MFATEDPSKNTFVKDLIHELQETYGFKSFYQFDDTHTVEMPSVKKDMFGNSLIQGGYTLRQVKSIPDEIHGFAFNKMHITHTLKSLKETLETTIVNYGRARKIKINGNEGLQTFTFGTKKYILSITEGKGIHDDVNIHFHEAYLQN